MNNKEKPDPTIFLFQIAMILYVIYDCFHNGCHDGSIIENIHVHP